MAEVELRWNWNRAVPSPQMPINTVYSKDLVEVELKWYKIDYCDTHTVVLKDELQGQGKKNLPFSWTFHLFFLSLHHRSISPSGWAGGLILWERRFLTSVVVHNELRKSVKPQQTDDNRDVCVERFYIPYLIYSPFWRGLMSVVYPVWFGQCVSLCI